MQRHAYIVAIGALFVIAALVVALMARADGIREREMRACQQQGYTREQCAVIVEAR